MSELAAEVTAAMARRGDRLGEFTPAITLPDDLVLAADGVPGWWATGGNRLYVRAGAAPPQLHTGHGSGPCTGALIVCAGDTSPGALVLWGDAPVILFGAGSHLPAGYFGCGGGSAILIGDRTGCTWNGRADARNGGIVAVGEDGLWGSDVQLYTDDMHAIRDRSGRRLNPFGGTVLIGRHVWLGRETMCLSGTRIGAGSVIGARSLTKGPLPADSVCAGSPARAIRHDVEWSFEDAP